MLEGLRIADVNLNTTIANKDFRTDGEFWVNEPKFNPSLKYAKIGDCLVSAQYGISIKMNEDEKGYPIYRMNEIHNMLCDIDVNKNVELTIYELNSFRLNDNDVLFNRTNSFEWVGRTGLYKKTDDRDFVFASYLVRFVPNKKIILPEYLTAFLNSKQGVWDVKRRARQSVNQTNVNPEEVKQIDIPILKIKTQELIKKCFDEAVIYIQQSQFLYTSAEDILYQELGLAKWQPTIKNNNTKTLKESFLESGRFDAEYYQPKYDELLGLLLDVETKPLGEIVFIKKSIEPGSDAYQTEGIPFIRVADLSKNGISESTVYLNESSFDVTSLMPKKGTILLTKDGSVGIAYKVEENIKGITSGAILHLTVTDKEFLPDYLTLVLNSIVVKLQAERDAGGSIIQHWKPDEIKQVIIPKLNRAIQTKISEKIQASFRLQKQSKDLLEAAKTAVEIAIEQDEQTALKYLQNFKDA